MEKFESIIVITAGRTGSQLVKCNLQGHFECLTIQTHNPLIQSNTDQLVVISKRFDDFNTIASTIIGRRTNEFVSYTLKHIEPFFVTKDEFESTFWFVRCHQAVSQKRFPSAAVVYYEPLISDSKYLFSLFGLDKSTDLNFPKSPYSAQQLISNYEELKSWFAQLCTQSVTETLLDSFIQSIEIDLSNINHTK